MMRGSPPLLLKKGREVDFVIKGSKKIEECIQVCFNPEDEATLHRKINSLLAGMEEFRLKKRINPYRKS